MRAGRGRQETRQSSARAHALGLAGRIVAIAAGICAVAGAAGAASAGAVVLHLPGATISYLPPPGVRAPQSGAEGNAKPDVSKLLEYHGGPVMPSNTDYALYWDPAGAPVYPAGYEAGIDRWFEDLAHDSGGVQNTDSVLTQYKDAAGETASYDVHFAGALVDTDAYPANGCSAAPICFTEEQLRSEIAAFVESNKLPSDLQHEYFLLTPPGVESCFEAAGHSCSDGTKHATYCAYHGYITVGTGDIVYANNPYVAGLNCEPGEEHPNDNPSDATIAGGLAHEHSESVTDPELTAWYDVKGDEVADKCRTFKQATEFGEPLGKAPDGANYNQVINGDLYWYQQEWSNEAGGCEQRSAQPPTVTKVTPKSGPTTGKTVVTVTGSNFAAPATVRFNGNLATEVTVKSSKSISAVSPPGAAGIVDVTVTTSTGSSPITKKDHFTYKTAK